MKTFFTILIGALLTITQVTSAPTNQPAANYKLAFYEVDDTGRMDKPPIIIDPSDPTDIYLPEWVYEVEIQFTGKASLQNAIYNLQVMSGVRSD